MDKETSSKTPQDDTSQTKESNSKTTQDDTSFQAKESTNDKKTDKQENINKIMELIKSSPLNLDEKQKQHNQHSEYRDGFSEAKGHKDSKKGKVRRLNVSRNNY